MYKSTPEANKAHKAMNNSAFSETSIEIPLSDYDALEKQVEDAHREAKHLAEIIHKRAYKEVTQWEVAEDTATIITQIDNIVAGLFEELEEEKSRLDYPHEEIEDMRNEIIRLRKALEGLHNLFSADSAKPLSDRGVRAHEIVLNALDMKTDNKQEALAEKEVATFVNDLEEHQKRDASKSKLKY